MKADKNTRHKRYCVKLKGDHWIFNLFDTSEEKVCDQIIRKTNRSINPIVQITLVSKRKLNRGTLYVYQHCTKTHMGRVQFELYTHEEILSFETELPTPKNIF